MKGRKNGKKWVSYLFSSEKIFFVIKWKLAKKKTDMYRIKGVVKKCSVENDKKKRLFSFAKKKYLLNKGWSG